MADSARVVPLPDLDSQAFWDACKKHELRAQRCTECHQFRWPPQEFCPHCYAWTYEWTRLPESGTVYSYTVVHHAVVPAFKADAPYLVANVTVDGTNEQVRLMTNVIDCSPDQIRVGLPVTLTFNELSADISLPKYRPS